MKKGTDQITAERLAGMIQKNWHARGFTQVATWAEAKGGEWAVKSNLINGAPPGTRPETLGYQLMGMSE